MQSVSLVIYFILAMGTAICFWQVRHFELLNYDDISYVTKNPHVLNGFSLENIAWAFTSSYQANWHPLTWLSLMLDCQLFGINSGEMHLINLFLHISNTLLLFALFKKMTGSLWPSAFVAAAFAIHPMHVESVAWVTERKDVLSTLFLLVTVFSYLGYIRQPCKWRYTLTLVIFSLGLMAKPMLVTLPLILLLLDFWPLGRFGSTEVPGSNGNKRNLKIVRPRSVFKKLLIEKVPFILIAAVSSAVTFAAQRSGGAVVELNELSFASRTANVFLSYVRYIGKMFWPQNLAVSYPFDLAQFSFWQIAGSALLLAIISIYVIRAARHKRYLFVGWFWFVITLIPVVGIVQVSDRALADRYSYIPYIGLFIMIAWGLAELVAKWPRGKLIVGFAGVSVLAALGVCTNQQVSYWKDSETLFAHALEITKNNYIAHLNFAETAYIKGDSNLAIEHYKKALKIVPGISTAAYPLGCILADQNDFGDAAVYFKIAIQSEPKFAEAHNRLGVAFAKKGSIDKAALHFKEAVQLKPEFIDARKNLAKALVFNNDFTGALQQFRLALKYKTDDINLMNEFAGFIVSHPEVNDTNEAVLLAERICELTEYKNPIFLGNLATAYVLAGKFDECIRMAEKGLEIFPNSASLHRNLGYALSSEHRYKKAIQHINRSLEIEPNNIRVKADLAWILAVNPDPNIRDPAHAVSLSKEICQATNYEDAHLIDTLGVAYASSGRFTEAVEAAQKGLRIINKNDINLKETMQERLDLYKASMPYIENQQ